MPLLLNNLVEVPPGRFRYHQKETDSTFGPYSSFNQLVDAVRVHRQANGIEPADDELSVPLELELQNWLCENITAAGYYCHEAGQPVRRTVSVEGYEEYADGKQSTDYNTGWDGSAKWKELHEYARNQRPSPAIRYLWLETFAASLPCGGCRKHWRALTKEKPLPKTATPEEFFAWTVDRHNDVNRNLGYDEMPLDAAKERWPSTSAG